MAEPSARPPSPASNSSQIAPPITTRPTQIQDRRTPMVCNFGLSMGPDGFAIIDPFFFGTDMAIQAQEGCRNGDAFLTFIAPHIPSKFWTLDDHFSRQRRQRHFYLLARRRPRKVHALFRTQKFPSRRRSISGRRRGRTHLRTNSFLTTGPHYARHRSHSNIAPPLVQ